MGLGLGLYKARDCAAKRTPDTEILDSRRTETCSLVVFTKVGAPE